MGSNLDGAVDATDVQKQFGFTVSEAVLRDQIKTLGNLCRVIGASVYDANILRWIAEHGGLHHSIDLVLSSIAIEPWILASEKTVRRSLNFWEREAIIEVERDRRDDFKRAIPNTVRIRWSSVLQRLLGTRSVASQTGSAVHAGVDYKATPHGLSVPTQGLSVPNEGHRVPGGCGPIPPLPQGARSNEQILACARGLSVCLTDSDVDVDDRDSSSPFLSGVNDMGESRVCSWTRLSELAREAMRTVHPEGPIRALDRRVIYGASAGLALIFFSEEWLMAAARSVQSATTHNRERYLLGCLRNNCFEMERVVFIANRQEATTWFSALMYAISPAIEKTLAARDRKKQEAVGAAGG